MDEESKEVISDVSRMLIELGELLVREDFHTKAMPRVITTMYYLQMALINLEKAEKAKKAEDAGTN